MARSDEGRVEDTPIKPDAIAVLAHPVVIGALAGWIINDWVLKARFGNALTGKLSDVFAMVVFPLLIAAVAGRVSRHPLRWGLAINAAFFTAINLSASADRFVERVLDLVIPSALTMDPTDLVVLPVTGIAAIVWRRVHRSTTDARQTARRRVGRMVFAAGALTCLATSGPEETRSDPHSGAILLTADQPVVTMPLEYDLNGDSSPALDVEITLTAYGAGDGGEVSRYDTVEWNATPFALSFELTDLSWAPVYVEWRAEALGGLQDCGLFRCSDTAEATMSIDVPPLASKPPPDHRVDLPATAQGEHALVFVTLGVIAAEPPALELPEAANFAALLDGRQLTARDNSRTWPIPIPESCAVSCEVTFPVIYRNDSPTSIGVFGSLSSTSLDAPPLVETRVELAIPVDELPAERTGGTFCVRAGAPAAPAETVFALSGISIVFDDAVEPILGATAQAPDGCFALRHRGFRADELAEHDRVVVTGVIRTTEEQAPDDLEVVMID